MKIDLLPRHWAARAGVRRARRRDVPGCAAIVQGWLDATPWLPDLHSLPETERWLARVLFPRCRVRVAERGGRVLGFVAIDRRRVIQALYVAEEARGRGTGAVLIGAAKALAPAGLRLWTFQPNLAARRFYARHGFHELRRTAGENEEGVPDILMGWRP